MPNLHAELDGSSSNLTVMPSRATPDGTVRMTLDECRKLLARGGVGRIVHTDGALPAVTPVSYQMAGTHLVFRLPAGAAIAPALAGSIVAVEVDDFDRFSGAGWSVVVIGEVSLWSPRRQEASEGTDKSAAADAAEHQVFTLSQPIMRGMRMALP